MLHNTYRTAMRLLGGLMVGGAALLVVMNAQTPGLCPPYPVIGVPACVVVLIYFTAMFAALSLGDDRASRWLFIVPTVLALATGIYFSATELLQAGPQCPQVFGIPLPLCFTVPPATALMLLMGWHGYRSAPASGPFDPGTGP